MGRRSKSDKARRERRRFARQRASLLSTAVEHHKAGNLREARKLYEQALEGSPKNSELMNALGSVSKALGWADEAMTYFKQAVEYNHPPSPIYRFNLGNLLMDLNRYPEAMVEYERSFEEADGHAARGQIETHLAASRARFGEPDKALAYYRKRVDSVGDFAAYHNLAGTLVLLQRAEESLPLYEKALELDPDSATTHNSYGNALAYLGRTDEAEEQYRITIRLAPRVPVTYHNLIKIRRKLTAEDVVTLRSVAEDASMTNIDRSFACFGLAHHYDRSKIYDEAWHYVTQANRLYGVTFDDDYHDHVSERVLKVFTKDFFRKHPTSGSQARPIFVVGMPRSGTSLVEQILSAPPGSTRSRRAGDHQSSLQGNPRSPRGHVPGDQLSARKLRHQVPGPTVPRRGW